MTTTEPAPNAGHEISGPLPVESRRPSLSDLASAAKADRNRAIDFYRVAAMAAVAIGHWMAVAVGVDADGKLIAGNALQSRPGLGILTWFFQVMPLFFVVGGFSSAMSLDSHAANSNSANSNGANSNGANSNAAGGGRPQDWVVARLRRMVSPAMVLATTWLGLLGFAALIDSAMGNGIRSGLTPLIAVGAVGAAIPLWFLANYTIDTAIAPYVLPLFRRQPALVAAGGATVFLALEGVRLADLSGPLHYLPYLNWVLGWLLFQVMGFAWRDGLLMDLARGER